jgi:hypothetical protein
MLPALQILTLIVWNNNRYLVFKRHAWMTVYININDWTLQQFHEWNFQTLNINNSHRYQLLSNFCNFRSGVFIFTPAGMHCPTQFICLDLYYHCCLDTGTSSIDWAQHSRLYLITRQQSSLQNFVFLTELGGQIMIKKFVLLTIHHITIIQILLKNNRYGPLLYSMKQSLLTRYCLHFYMINLKYSRTHKIRKE